MRAAATRLCATEREPGGDEPHSWSRQSRVLARLATFDIIFGVEFDGRGAWTEKEHGMLIQLRGKARRAVVGTMLSEEDRAGIAGARRGECNRCGACCKILFTCPFWSRTRACSPAASTITVRHHAGSSQWSRRIYARWMAARLALRSLADVNMFSPLRSPRATPLPPPSGDRGRGGSLRELRGE